MNGSVARPIKWYVSIRADADRGYRVTLTYSNQEREFSAALPPDITRIVPFIENPRGVDTIEKLARRATIEDLRQVGIELYTALLFDPENQIDYGEVLQTLVDQAKSEKRDIAFRLDLTDAPDLLDVPWEALYSAKEKSFFATRELFGLTRMYADEEIPPPDPVDPPLRLLVAVADPTGKLDTAAEVARLKAVFAETRDGVIRIDDHYVEQADRLAFAQKVSDWNPHVVHYIGHGEFDGTGNLWLHVEGKPGEIDRLDAEELRGIFADRPPWMVVLNSCEGGVMRITPGFGGLAQELLELGIPFVVAMQSRISDKAAIIFARNFYTAVAQGAPISHAMARARNLIRTGLGKAGGVEMITPALYAACNLDQIQFAPEPMAVPPIMMPAATATPAIMAELPTNAETHEPRSGRPAWMMPAIAGGVIAGVIALAVSLAGLFLGAEREYSATNDTSMAENVVAPDTEVEDYADNYTEGPSTSSGPIEGEDMSGRPTGAPGIDRGHGRPGGGRSPAGGIDTDDGDWTPDPLPTPEPTPTPGPVAEAVYKIALPASTLSGPQMGPLVGAIVGVRPVWPSGCGPHAIGIRFEPGTPVPVADPLPAVEEFVASQHACANLNLMAYATASLPGREPLAAELAFRRAHQAALLLHLAGVSPGAVAELPLWESEEPGEEGDMAGTEPQPPADSMIDAGDLEGTGTAMILTSPAGFLPLEIAAALDSEEASAVLARWGAYSAHLPLRLELRAWNLPAGDPAVLAAAQAVRAARDEAIAEEPPAEDVLPPGELVPLRFAAETPVRDAPPHPLVEARFLDSGIDSVSWQPGQVLLDDATARRLGEWGARFGDRAEAIENQVEAEAGPLEFTRVLLEAHSRRTGDPDHDRRDALVAASEVAVRLRRAGVEPGRIMAISCGAQRSGEISADADRTVTISIVPPGFNGPQSACGWDDSFWLSDVPGVPAEPLVIPPLPDPAPPPGGPLSAIRPHRFQPAVVSRVGRLNEQQLPSAAAASGTSGIGRLAVASRAILRR